MWRQVSGEKSNKTETATVKESVYQKFVRKAMLFCLGRVTLTKRLESELDVAELKMVRFSLGVMRTDRVRNEHIRERKQVGSFGRQNYGGWAEMVWTWTQEGQ